jgi:hypothetical protein
MAGILSSSPFRNSKPHPQIWSETLGIARRSSGRFQLRRAITFDSCVVDGIRGYCCVRLVESFILVSSIHRSDPQFDLNRRICAQLRRTSSSPMINLHCWMLFFGFVFPAQPLSLPSPCFPLAAVLPPPSIPPSPPSRRQPAGLPPPSRHAQPPPPSPHPWWEEGGWRKKMLFLQNPPGEF